MTPDYFKIDYLFLVPLLLSAIFSLKAFRQKWPKPYRLYAILVIITFFTEFTAIAWTFKLHKFFNAPEDNLWLYNPFIIVEFGMLAAIFYLILNKPIIKKIFPIVAILIILFCMLDFIFIHGPSQYNTYSMIITHVCVIVLCLLYTRQLLQEPDIIVIHKEPMAWMALSVFVYRAASLPFLIMFGFLNMIDHRLTWLFRPINITLNFLLCLCYLISFLWKPQSTQPH